MPAAAAAAVKSLLKPPHFYCLHAAHQTPEASSSSSQKPSLPLCCWNHLILFPPVIAAGVITDCPSLLPSLHTPSHGLLINVMIMFIMLLRLNCILSCCGDAVVSWPLDLCWAFSRGRRNKETTSSSWILVRFVVFICFRSGIGCLRVPHVITLSRVSTKNVFVSVWYGNGKSH